MKETLDNAIGCDNTIPEFGDLDFESEREEEQRRLEREQQEKERERQGAAVVGTVDGKPSSGRGAARGGRRGRPKRDASVGRTRQMQLDRDTTYLLDMASVRLTYLQNRNVSKAEIVRNALVMYLRKVAPEVLRAAEILEL